MSTDATSREAGPPRPDLWALPEIVGIEVNRRRYRRPRVHYERTRRVESREAVEILVRTSGEIPARAKTPALYVGDVPLPEFETVGANEYRFFAYEPDRLQADAPIGFGWPDFPARRVESRYRYEPPKG